MIHGENRLGKFTLPILRERQSWPDLLPLFGNFVIVEARYRYDLGAIEYIAYSSLFDLIPNGVCAPEYEFDIALMPNGPAIIKAYRTESKITQRQNQ